MPCPEVDIIDTLSNTTFAHDISLGQSVVIDVLAGPMDVGIDLDDDGVVDVLYESFELDANQVVHVSLTNHGPGTPTFLVSHMNDGDTRIRTVVPSDTGLTSDTSATTGTATSGTHTDTGTPSTDTAGSTDTDSGGTGS